jgi:hypothetical protein
MHETGSLEWLTRGSGSFGSISRPVPSQPWRPVRMRITGTGSLLPELQVDVASKVSLGKTMAVSPSAHGKDVPGKGKAAPEVLKQMIQQQREHRASVEARLEKLQATLQSSSPSSGMRSPALVRVASAGSSMSRRGELVLSSPTSGPPAPFSPIVRRPE